MPALGAEVIDMALRQHRAHPGQNRAAAVEVAEDRAAAPVANLEPVHLGPYRIRQLAPAHLVAGNRARGGVKRRPETGDEILPRRGFSSLARERKAQVFGVNRVDVTRRRHRRRARPPRARRDTPHRADDSSPTFHRAAPARLHSRASAGPCCVTNSGGASLTLLSDQSE